MDRLIILDETPPRHGLSEEVLVKLAKLAMRDGTSIMMIGGSRRGKSIAAVALRDICAPIEHPVDPEVPPRKRTSVMPPRGRWSR